MKFNRQDVRTSLTAALPPAPSFDLDAKTVAPSRTLREAIDRLGNEAVLLEQEVRGEHPFHGTLNDLVERMR